MQSSEPSTELSFLRVELARLKEAFDLAIQKDLTLGEVKNIFHEMRMVHDKIDRIEEAIRSGSRFTERNE